MCFRSRARDVTAHDENRSSHVNGAVYNASGVNEIEVESDRWNLGPADRAGIARTTVDSLTITCKKSYSQLVANGIIF